VVIYRATGSLAFVAAARAAFAIARDKDDPKRRLILPMKNNLADDQSGLAYRVATGLNGAPCLLFEPEPVTISADDALAGAGTGPRPRDEATEWLRALLADGPVPAAQVWEEAKAAGFTEVTCKRAKRQLRVETYKPKGSLAGGWMWRLPGAEGDHLAGAGGVIPFGMSEPLRRGSEREEDHRRAPRRSDPLPETEVDSCDPDDGAWKAKL
jgi:hypothetical protein